jgi:hypothetical protein
MLQLLLCRAWLNYRHPAHAVSLAPLIKEYRAQQQQAELIRRTELPRLVLRLHELGCELDDLRKVVDLLRGRV